MNNKEKPRQEEEEEEGVSRFEREKFDWATASNLEVTKPPPKDGEPSFGGDRIPKMLAIANGNGRSSK
jgi:hypothetical protein